MSVYYADTSAVIKLLVDEAHTSAMAAFFDEHEDWDWASSNLLRIEVARAINRVQPEMLPDARELLDYFAFIPVNDDIVERAMTEPAPDLRSLDAIHLATARSLAGDLAGLVSYDGRLLAASSDAGLAVVTPTD